MAWYVDISLKSGKNIVIDNLKSINKQSSTDGSVAKIVKFDDFYLTKGQRLSFVGETAIATLTSDEIEYIEFKQHN